MEEDIEPRQSDSFLVKIVAGDGPDLTGQVQHVLTGEKRRFQGLEELGRALAHLKRRSSDA